VRSCMESRYPAFVAREGSHLRVSALIAARGKEGLEGMPECSLLRPPLGGVLFFYAPAQQPCH
jgi:hypothetical protein